MMPSTQRRIPDDPAQYEAWLIRALIAHWQTCPVATEKEVVFIEEAMDLLVARLKWIERRGLDTPTLTLVPTRRNP